MIHDKHILHPREERRYYLSGGYFMLGTVIIWRTNKGKNEPKTIPWHFPGAAREQGPL